MLANAKRFESLVQLLYANDSLLPPLWQVIYQEGIRANHILFDHDDVERFLAADGLESESMSEHETEAICCAALDVLRASDLRGMRLTISRLTSNEKRRCFYLYLRALRFWRDHLKQSLN